MLHAKLIGANSMRIIDISGALKNEMWCDGPLIPEVKIEKVLRIDEIGFDVDKITFSSVSGTYFETAAHLFKGRALPIDVPLEKLICNAVVAHIPQKNSLEHITAQELEKAAHMLNEGEALLVHTGWDRMWNKNNFTGESPHFSSDGMDWIIQKKVSTLGADIPCFDDPIQSEGLLERFYRLCPESMLLGPVVNLGLVIYQKVTLIVLPLKVEGVSAVPCRAIVLEDRDKQQGACPTIMHLIKNIRVFSGETQ